MNPVPPLTLNNGLKSPVLGLGVWQIEDAAVESVVLTALNLGYRLIDTAKIYKNEAGVGRAIRASKIPRKDIFLVTKLWADGFLLPASAYQASLDRLGLDYADLYLLHWPFPFWSQAWKGLEKLYQEGKIKSIGVSNFSIRQLESLQRKFSVTPAVNQVEFHPFLFRSKLLEYCQQKGIVLQAYCPLTRGKKINHPVIAEIAKDVNRTPAQIMLRWSLQHGLIVLPKSSHPLHLAENLNVFDFKLSDTHMSALDALNQNYRSLF